MAVVSNCFLSIVFHSLFSPNPQIATDADHTSWEYDGATSTNCNYHDSEVLRGETKNWATRVVTTSIVLDLCHRCYVHYGVVERKLIVDYVGRTSKPHELVLQIVHLVVTCEEVVSYEPKCCSWRCLLLKHDVALIVRVLPKVKAGCHLEGRTAWIASEWGNIDSDGRIGRIGGALAIANLHTLNDLATPSACY